MLTAARGMGGGANSDRKSTGPHSYIVEAPRPQAPADCPPNLRAVGTFTATINVRRQRQAERLHRLGPRATLEALAEVAAGRHLDNVLGRFAALDPAIVGAVGGDVFPPVPLHRVTP